MDSESPKSQRQHLRAQKHRLFYPTVQQMSVSDLATRKVPMSMLLHSLYIGRHRRQQNYLDATIMPAMILTNFSKNELNCWRMHLIIIMVIERWSLEKAKVYQISKSIASDKNVSISEMLTQLHWRS